MGYCWIKKKDMYNSSDVQNMLDFLGMRREDREKFIKLVESGTNSRDASAIKYCMTEGFAEAFDRFDSDVCEQFIRMFENAFIKTTSYKPRNRFAVVGHTGDWYGIIDTKDGVVEFLTKPEVMSYIQRGFKIDGVSSSGVIKVI